MTATKKADGFRAASAKAREGYAAVVLDANTILADASEAAANGEQAHAVVFDKPVDLPQTEAGKALKTLLQEHGFTVEWNKRAIVVGGMEKAAWTLIVRW